MNKGQWTKDNSSLENSERYYAKVPPLDQKVGVTSSDFATWAALCMFVDWKTDHGQPVKSKDGSCFPTTEVIAERACMSRRSFMRCLKHLEKLNYLRITKRHGISKSGQPGKGLMTNDYTLYPLGNAPKLKTKSRQKPVTKEEKKGY